MVGANPEDWDINADIWAERLKGGPAWDALVSMVAAANECVPFSRATAILDNGCGPGNAMNWIIEHYSSQLPVHTRLIASDFSKGMISQLLRVQKEQASNRHWRELETHVCDARDLRPILQGNTISHMLSSFALFYVPHPLEALREAHRVLSSENGGGVLALTSWQEIEWMSILEIAQRVRPDAEMGLQIPKEWSDPTLLRTQLEEAGFRDIKIHTVESGIPLSNVEEFVNEHLEAPIEMNRKPFEKMSVEEKDRTKRLIIEHLHKKHPSMPSKMKGIAIVTTCRK